MMRPVVSNKRNTIALALLLLIAHVLASPVAWGQLLQGTINGNVTDSSKAAIPGARVIATNQDTNFVRESVTNSAGVYDLPDVPPGTYAVTVSSPSFQSYTLTNVVVTVQTATRVDVSLTVGQVTQTLTVAAQAGNLQTDRADVHSEISGQLLNSVPVPIGRNYQMLFTTIPGVSPPKNVHSFGGNSGRSLSFSVNGGSSYANDTRIDGAGTMELTGGDDIRYIPAMEAIETVSVATSSFEADQSSGGGYVSVTVKSGTNALHGSLFEDHTDKNLNTYAWVADRTQPKLPFITNQFGGTIGGPIKKDKLFYFASYEGTRLVQGNAVQAEVPTPAMKGGDLSASPTPIYDPMTGSANGTSRAPFSGNIIPSARIDPGVKAMIATGSWPNPNQTGTGSLGLSNNFLCSGCQGNSGARRDQLDAKVNWVPSPKLSTFVRFGFNNSDWYDPQIFGLLGGPAVSPTNTAVGIGAANVYSGTISGTYLFTPNLLADAYFGYSRDNMYSRQPYQNQNLGSTLLAIPGLSTAGLPQNKQLDQGGMPVIAAAGFASLGLANNYQPQIYDDPEKNLSANLSWIKGRHNLRAGFDADFQDSNETQYQFAGSKYTSAGTFNFAQGTTQLSGGKAGNDYNAFASLLLGLPSTAGKIYQFPDKFYTRSRSFGIYIRDHWQVGPKLTVNFGVRWDYFAFPQRLGTGVEIYNPQSATMSICGVGSTPTDCGITKDRQHLDPRLGVAYRLSNSTVVRAGYSVSTDPTLLMGGSLAGRLNFPYVYAQNLSAPNTYSYTATLRQGIPVVAAPDTSTGNIPVPGLDSVVTYNNANYVRGYVQTWNFTVEQRVIGWITSGGYVASRAIDPQNNLEMNWSPINGGTAGQLLNQLTGRTASTVYVGTLGTNKYDSLQTRAQRRFGGGYQMNFAYTFSKALGYGTVPTVAIPQYYRLNYGPQGSDIAHAFSATGIADLPFGKGKRFAQTGLASKLAGGWQVSTVAVAHTGSPFTVTAAATSLNAPNSTQFGDCIAPAQEVGSIYQWYKPSSFAAPTTARFGTCGTGSLFGPGLINADLGVNRRIRVSEKLQLSFRAEMFNVANTPHHSSPTGNVSSSSFMQATGIINTGRDGIEQRAVRLAMRLVW